VGPSERILVWRLRRGERGAARELVRRHHEGVYGYLRRLGADPAQAEDLTQETYARAWQRIGTLRRAASLRSWLLTIARNEFFQWMRTQHPDVTSPREAPEREDPAPGAHEVLARSQRDRRLRRAVDRLEPDLRETVSLHYFLELSLREVADVLGIPPGTVKSRLNRALGCLRALLDKEEADHEGTRAEEALAGP
jgi:RNA polymerase sigma-70 factor (ECF subfamily)